MRLFLLTALIACLVAVRPAGAGTLQIVQPDNNLSPKDVVFFQLHTLCETHADDGRNCWPASHASRLSLIR
jgi:hypothetical protein